MFTSISKRIPVTTTSAGISHQSKQKLPATGYVVYQPDPMGLPVRECSRVAVGLQPRPDYRSESFRVLPEEDVNVQPSVPCSEGSVGS